MLTLYSYWRSSASYRVRIALNLKGLDYRTVPVHLVRDGGQQFAEPYRSLNPQRRVPLLVDGEFRVAQSLAIIEYLDALQASPRLLPLDAQLRARVQAFSMAIAADVQPMQNTGTLNYLRDVVGLDEAGRAQWLRHFLEQGLSALEAEAATRPPTPFVFGDAPTMADCVLVPQIFAARRFACDMSKLPRLAAIAAHCDTLPAFQRAHPAQQPDAE
ncbi:maleylacetoacetate isomerase [Solimonas terrae]|uniref:Maleylacetoacetate isomerase n=1 Tax=Solimonas terrae TaxID=1396819 RepID=A0A6M2BSD7_9GAMM|nr:maleylacetoacetate isomerase [Solimonas terrae]NGY04949.1 maleylacetoacetate isomerase [Solimonas terrae]